MPVHTDRTLFEFPMPEGAQAGSSRLRVLCRRPHDRRLFADFDAEQMVRFHAARISLTRPIVIYAPMQATGHGQRSAARGVAHQPQRDAGSGAQPQDATGAVQNDQGNQRPDDEIRDI